MISGVSEVIGMFDVLRELDIVDCPVDIPRAANYSIWLGGHTLRMSLSDGDEEVIDDITEEELEIMSFCDEGYRQWFDQHLSKNIEDAIFGGEDDE